MKGWRNFPGYHGATGAAPGVHGGGFHVDDDPVPLSHVAPEDFPFIPPNICTALHYLAGAPPELCPTRVIPGSHRSGRRPEAHEREFNGRTPLSAVAEPGDVLIFRCDVWHAVRPPPPPLAAPLPEVDAVPERQQRDDGRDTPLRRGRL